MPWLTSYQGGHVSTSRTFENCLTKQAATRSHLWRQGRHHHTTRNPYPSQSGISKIYSPDDGRTMGLMGMIHHLMGQASEVDLVGKDRMDSLSGPVTPEDMAKVGLLLTLSESADEKTFKAAVKAYAPLTRRARHRIHWNGWGRKISLDELMLRIQQTTRQEGLSALR